MRKFKKNGKYIVAVMLVFLLAFGGAITAFGEDPDVSYTESWDGRGTDSEKCKEAGEGERPDDGSGWIHWVFSTKGDSTNAELILEGTGSGTYSPGKPLNAEVWHFYTPYYGLDGLSATIYLYGGDPGSGGGLVISDYCPGYDPKPEYGAIKVIKVLLDADDDLIDGDATEFEVKINGTVYKFSVDEPFKDDFEVGTYSIEEVEHNDYTFVGMNPDDDEVIVKKGETTTVTITNKVKPPFVIPTGGSICVTKMDVDRNLLEGWEFTLYRSRTADSEKHIVRRADNPASTGENGKVCWDDLDDGFYEVRETPQEGWSYYQHRGYQAVKLEYDENPVVNIRFLNKKDDVVVPELGSICVTKTNENGRFMPGWEFTLYSRVGTVTDDYVVVRRDNPGVTDAGGKLCWNNLPYGSYKVVETDARLDNGWSIVSPTSGSYTRVLDSTTPVELRFVNKMDVPERAGYLKIVKVLRDVNGNLINNSDVRFYVNASSPIGFDWVSVNRPWMSGQLAPGNYTIPELAKAGYHIVGPASGVVEVKTGQK